MTPSNHNVIGTQRFEVGMNLKRRPIEVQDAFARAQRNQLERTISEVLEEFARPDRWHRLGSVQLNIGPVSYDHLERDLNEGVKLHLRRALRGLFDHAEQEAVASPEDAVLDPAMHLTELLRHYLLHGTYPWWGTAELPGPDALFDAMVTEFAKRLVTMIRDIGRRASVRRRLVLQFDDPRLHRLVSLLEPTHAAFIIAYADELREKHEKKRVVPDDSSSFRNAKWEFILKYILVDRGSLFNRRAFIKSLLQNLAASYRLEYLKFLEFMQAEFRAEFLPHELTSSLPFLIRELLIEERLRTGAIEDAEEGLLPDEVTEAARQAREAQWVIHYLKFGTLPPEAQDAAALPQQEWELRVRAWVEAHDALFRRLFRKHVIQADPFASPSSHFSHDMNWFLLKAYAKADHAMIFSMTELVERIVVERSGVEHSSNRLWMSKMRWAVTFRALGAKKAALRSGKELFALMVDEWAHVFEVPAASLTHRVFYASMSAGAEVLLHSPELIDLAQREGIIDISRKSAQSMVKRLQQTWQEESGPRDRRISRLLQTLEELAMKQQTDVVSALVSILVQLQSDASFAADDMTQALDVILKRLASAQSAQPLKSGTDGQKITKPARGKRVSKKAEQEAELEQRLKPEGGIERVTDAFLYVMRQGGLPWWSPFESVDEVERAFAWFIKKEPKKLRLGLAKLLANDRLLIRVAGTTSSRQLELLLEALDPSESHVLRSAMISVEFVLEQEFEVLGKLPADWKKTWRLFLLQAAIFKPRTVASESKFWTWVWQELEARLGVKPDETVILFRHFLSTAPLPVAARKEVAKQLEHLEKTLGKEALATDKPWSKTEFEAFLKTEPNWASLFRKSTDERDLETMMRLPGGDRVVLYFLYRQALGKSFKQLSQGELILLLMEIARKEPAQVRSWLSDPKLRSHVVDSWPTKDVQRLRTLMFPNQVDQNAQEQVEAMWLEFAETQLTALQFEKFRHEFQALLLLEAAYLPLPKGGLAVVMLRLMLHLLARFKRKPVSEILPALFEWRESQGDALLSTDELSTWVNAATGNAFAAKRALAASLGKPEEEEEETTKDKLEKSKELDEEAEEQPEQEEDDEEEEEEPETDDMVFVNNAGTILLWPFLSVFFERAGLMKAGQFNSPKDAYRGVHLLYYAVWKKEKPAELELALNKVLCGVKPGKPLLRDVSITDEEKQLCEEMITVVTQRWEVLKNTSPDGLRESFLQRNGKLFVDSGIRTLVVEKKSFDMLLDQIPWSISNVRLGWMEEMLHIRWR